MTTVETKPTSSEATAAGESQGLPVIRKTRIGPAKRTVALWQIGLVIFGIAAWEFLPQIPGISTVVSFLDPFFISSPSRIVVELWLLLSGTAGGIPIWGPMIQTLVTSLIGTIVSLALGSLAGLAVSNWATLAAISKPFISFFNAIPRVAMIPIIVLLVRSAEGAEVMTAFTVVFFLVFFNAAEGAGSVPAEMIQNAQLLGASKLQIMWKVRWPTALEWTLASLPNAIAFGLTGTITSELFIGGKGLGYLLLLGIDNSNATLLFSIVFIVAIVGVVLVLGSERLRRVLMPWWQNSVGV